MTKVGPDEIIDCAVLLFRCQGYHATSMRDLAAAVGIQQGSLYNHFPSKQAIAAAAIARVGEAFRGAVLSAADPAAMAAATLDFFDVHGSCVLARLSFDVGHDAQCAEVLRTIFAEWRDRIAKLIGRRDLAEDLVCALEGAVLWLSLFGERAPLRRACDQLARASATVTALAEAEERAERAEMALRGQIEAASCFL